MVFGDYEFLLRVTQMKLCRERESNEIIEIFKRVWESYGIYKLEKVERN